MKCFAIVSDKFNFRIIKYIDDQEYQEASNFLIYIERLELIYSSKIPLVENFKELMNLFEDYKNGIVIPIVVKYYVIIRIQNLLSSIRGYIDTFAHTLSMEYGDTSDIYLEFDKQKSKAYDEIFSYRFIETLRNFAQHRALPLSKLNFLTENGQKAVKVIINKTELLNDPKIKAKKKIDIDNNCPDEIELTTHLKTMFGCLMLIHDQMLRMAIDVKQIENFFIYEKKFSEFSGSLILLDRKYKENDGVELSTRTFNFSRIRLILSEMSEVIERFHK